MESESDIITATPCFAHTLQLKINDSIKTVEGLEENLKIGNDIVAFYRRSHVGLRNLIKTKENWDYWKKNYIQLMPRDGIVSSSKRKN